MATQRCNKCGSELLDQSGQWHPTRQTAVCYVCKNNGK
jgi:hypothetical protein